MRKVVVVTFALVCLVAASSVAQPSLRIVVIEGEDAVNVVQQKTATRPVVEVRDRNNLPVPGVLVTFSIEGGKAASFGGVSTLTVATNTAGQAAATSLTPTAAGAFQIQVSAAFQGQLATATIAQTNVMTAAQAAAASAATGTSGSSASTAGGGAAGGGGGGLSTTAIAVTGAAVAGGAVAAAQVAKARDGGSNEIFTGSLTGQALRVTTFRDTGVTACVNTRAITGSVHVEIDGDGQGEMIIKGTDSEVSSTCGFAPGTDEVNWSIPFSGTNAAIRGTQTGLWDSVVAGVRGSVTTSFEGERHGDRITGTLTLDTRFASIGGGIVFDHRLTGSFPLTLTMTAQ